MGRSPASFAFLARKLRKTGHRVSLFGYTVRNTSLDDIAERFVTHVRGVLDAEPDEAPRYAIVAHSLGSVIVRMASPRLPAGFDRFAMLAPPNRAPLLARRLRDRGLFKAMAGDAGQRLADPEFIRNRPVPDTATLILAGVMGMELWRRKSGNKATAAAGC
jgi:alpha-beta hydrolase superfamily lysophospholipase